MVRFALAALALAALAAGCRSEPPAPASPPDATYIVRGEIRQLPRPGSRELLIRHEAIPELRDAQGKVVGMASMTMPFALGPDVDRSTLAAGQRIELTLELRWGAADVATVSRIVPLPAGTRLAFDPPEAQPVEPPTPGVPAAGSEGGDGDTPR